MALFLFPSSPFYWYPSFFLFSSAFLFSLILSSVIVSCLVTCVVSVLVHDFVVGVRASFQCAASVVAHLDRLTGLFSQPRCVQPCSFESIACRCCSVLRCTVRGVVTFGCSYLSASPKQINANRSSSLKALPVNLSTKRKLHGGTEHTTQVNGPIKSTRRKWLLWYATKWSIKTAAISSRVARIRKMYVCEDLWR